MKKGLVGLLICLGLITMGAETGKTGEQTGQTLNKKITKEIKCNYLLYLPADYKKDAKKKWPLILFLHGAGERGENLELVKKHGDKISFMGDINNSLVDREDWNQDLVAKEVKRACEQNGKHYFIPCITQGGKGAVYDGVYDAISKEIDKMSKIMFK